MNKSANNFAFIDAQNIHLGIRRLGWKMDMAKFNRYLRDKYRVTRAFLFIGYMAENQSLYNDLQDAGFTLVFKPVVRMRGKAKGNVDAELVLQAMIELPNYDGAVIATSDGDFACLVNRLAGEGKLRLALSAERKTCSPPF